MRQCRHYAWVIAGLCAALTGMTGAIMARNIDGLQDVKGTPAALYGSLFTAVQEQHLFADSKSFADAIAVAPAKEIMDAYHREVKLANFDLKSFVTRYFRFEAAPQSVYQSQGEDICTHIRNLWPVLTRQPQEAPAGSSLLPLKYPYVVPGGRFREIYYWDSYFTMLGLRASGETKLMRSMVQNFADLIARYGHVPNGNRSYYLSRSQPPFFALMVDSLAAEEGDRVYREFLPALQKEYAFWMDGEGEVWSGHSFRRLVKLPDGSLLNRYYSDSAMPRDEAWREDIATAQRSSQLDSTVFLDLRAAAESGWDFSSRWLKDPQDLATIRTTDIVPVDLNSLLYHLEQVLAQASDIAGQANDAELYRGRAAARKQAINDYLWNEDTGIYADYIIPEKRISDQLTAAGFYPLFFNLADDVQAERMVDAASADLLKPGGLVTTNVQTGQQWDDPNVWAPLQWIAVRGLQNYNNNLLAEDIARRWLTMVTQNYRLTGALKEKYYAYQADKTAGGGEYPNQDGFGWTNGVVLGLFQMFPYLLPECSRAK